MRITVTVLAGYFAFALVAPVAEAANRFAMTCIENKTDITLNYRKKWGKNDLSGLTQARTGEADFAHQGTYVGWQSTRSLCDFR